MKLTKKLEGEILKAYHAYWEAYLKGDMRTMSFWMHKNIRMIGSGRSEFFKNKKETVQYYKSTAKQVAGKAAMRNRKISVMPVGNQILVSEACDFFVLIGKVWTFYEQGRISTLFTQTNNGWKIIEEHGSMPDARTAGGEQVNTDKIKAENIRLKDAVKRRTLELEEKNHALKIETALEKVRAVAMGMRKPEHLLRVCETMYKEFLSLGFAEIRNAIINIYNNKDRSFINYDYAGTAGKNIGHFSYTVLPFVEKIIRTSQRTDDAFSESYLAGKTLASFKRLRKKSGQKDDPRLNRCSALYFYFYSLGIGTIGISTFGRITEEKKEQLKRFRNVFALAYQRYTDIAKAEAQARESQVQLALERVRARTMAMQKSEEIKETTLVLFQQFKSLGESTAQVSICVFDEETKMGEMFLTLKGEKIDSSFIMELDKETFVTKKVKRVFLAHGKKFSFSFTGKELQNYNRWRNRIIGKKGWDESDAVRKQYWYVNGVLFSRGMMGISSDTPPSEEALKLLERFGNVFDLTFTRFLDLQKAEAQAREAQIQLALERVRARTMAMQKSDELSETVALLFQQFRNLGEEMMQMTIGIVKEEEGVIEFNVTDWGGSGRQVNRSFRLSIEEPTLISKMYRAWKKKLPSVVVDLTGKALAGWIRYRNKMSGITVHSGDTRGRRVVHIAPFSKGLISFSSPQLRPPGSLQILERFAGVFDLTYTRFLDLQNAELQARKAEIELALERVRARSLAMHQTAEIQAVIQTVHEELLKLKISIDGGSFVVINKDIDTELHCWGSGGTADTSSEIYVPHFGMPFCTNLIRGIKKGPGFFTEEFSQRDKIAYFTELFKHEPWSKLKSKQKKEVLDATGGYTRSVCVSNHTSIFIINHHGRKFSNDENAILKRFTKVFEQSYTRFLDLQKAEAQAREAQIEASLERVRSKVMAMHNSNDLSSAASVVFTELERLGIYTIRSGISLQNKENRKNLLYSSTRTETENNLSLVGWALLDNHPVLKEIYDSWIRGEDYFPVLEGKVLKAYYEKIKSSFVVPKEQAADYEQHGYFISFTQGMFYGWAEKPFTESEKAVLKRFASVVDLTFKRFFDLQKAESQAREAQIETSLERVRARTMAMHNSEDVSAATATMFTELEKLGIACLRGGISRIMLNRTQEVWSVTTLEQGKTVRSVGSFPIDAHPFWQQMYALWTEKKEFMSYFLTGREKTNYINVLNASPNYFAEPIKDIPDVYFQIYFFSEGAVWANTLQPHTEDEKQIMKRFAGVFSLTFRRYQDLLKAEAQAREAQIEAALERVRSKAMAMHHTHELLDAGELLYKELTTLGISSLSVTYSILSDDEKSAEYYGINPIDGKVGAKPFVFPHTETAVMREILKAWKNQETIHAIELDEAATLKHQTWAGEHILNGIVKHKLDIPFSVEEFLKVSPKKAFISTFNFKQGYLFIIGDSRLANEQQQILLRFTKVFELTYRRFLDLQQAEAQAKEAQIEAALERVRSRTMAMFKSDELAETATVVFKQLIGLGIEPNRLYIALMNSEGSSAEFWITDEDGSKVSRGFVAQLRDNRSFIKMQEAWTEKRKTLVIDMQGEELKEYVLHLRSLNVPFKEGPVQMRRVQYIAFFGNGFIGIASPEPQPESTMRLLERFASVFNLTYTRFLDLQKAEAQARESQVEAALERVRSRSLAMHKSSELNEVVALLFAKLGDLGISADGVNINIQVEGTRDFDSWLAEPGHSYATCFRVPYFNHSVIDDIYNTYNAKKDLLTKIYSLEEKRTFFTYLYQNTGFKYLPEERKQMILDAPRWEVSIAFAEKIALSLHSYSGRVFSERENEILIRFAKVFGQSYIRFQDLKKAEENAKEAAKQASLDRIRADIASMRSMDDLNRITPLIWNELTLLGIPFIRCGVFIMDDAAKMTHTFLSTPEGKAIAAFRLPYDSPGQIADVVTYWRQHKIYLNHWGPEEFSSLADSLVQQGAFTSREQYLNSLPKKGVYLHFLPFLQGMLYVGNTEKLKEDDIHLLQSVADAFSTAYARYEDFNKLEAAKDQVEETLSNLRQTQQQLVQSEKMASLGELTAGIAHEIQNPLNFVNNFSEVSKELLDEMKDELEMGNVEDARQLANDVIQNMEKINFHGRRADGIVKGMLQHSRASSGQKELTDINVLCDEYLRLSYHGLRAKDKSFNAKFETDFDPSIGKINIVPQEIGRVILNLINNAFYAVTEKKKWVKDGYEPTVIVSTKQIIPAVTGHRFAEIRVQDNGTGIPQKVMDKIFQPFFTTKPTGQGTGLGLSLSYDIVTKAHGGDLKVETTEGQGSTFIIQLPVTQR